MILASVTMMAVEGDEENSKASLSSWWAWWLSSFSLLQTLNEIWSEKLSILLSPGENSEWSGIKNGKLSLNLLVILTKWLLIRECCWLVRESRCMKFWGVNTLLWGSMREHMRWLGSSLCAHSYDLLPSFWKCSLMGMSPVMASIPYEGNVLKAPRIHIAALLCIFPKAFRWYIIGAWL